MRFFRLKDDDEGRLREIEEEVVTRRWDSLDNPADLRRLGKKLMKLRTRDNLRIKQFPTGHLKYQQLVAFLDGLDAVERFVPDLLIVDYPKLMHLDPGNLRLELGSLYERLRGLAIERNMAVGIAAQLNREGASAIKSREGMDLAEDVSLLATADSVVFYNQTEAEQEQQLARLFVVGRNDRSRFTVLISQAYEIGQFCVESRMLTPEYWMLMRHGSSKDGNQPEEN